MDGPFYCDHKLPFVSGQATVVTMSTSLLPLLANGYLPIFPANYWWPGKAVRIRILGSANSGTTPGNNSINIYYGNNGAGAGVFLTGITFTTWTTSTASSFWFEAVVRCRSVGTSGALFAAGWYLLQGTGIGCVPPSAPAVGVVDTTAAGNTLSIQISRSGSTAESMQASTILYEALN